MQAVHRRPQPVRSATWSRLSPSSRIRRAISSKGTPVHSHRVMAERHHIEPSESSTLPSIHASIMKTVFKIKPPLRRHGGDLAGAPGAEVG